MKPTITALTEAINSGKQTAVSIIAAALEKAESAKSHNALLSVTADRALERAKKIDEMIANNTPVGKLAGVPFVVKDNFLSFGAPTTAASKMLEDFDAPLQATVVEKLEAEGAICIGKANLDAFAHGGSTENSAFGPTKNAIDDSRVAGGSSGGSAVVTALDIVPFALGTDTGGSIRQPAGFNGVYGIKPTYGALSRFGVVAMSSGLDTVGCFARSAEDIDIVMSIMAGSDERDMTTIGGIYDQVPVQKSMTIGLIKETMTDDVQPEIRDAVHAYANTMAEQGHRIKEVSLDMIRYTLAMYYIIVSAEVSSNLARYDGVRYGLRAESANTLTDLYGMTRDAGFVDENKRRIILGSYVLSSGYFDAYYLKAQKARTLLIEQFDRLFDDCDFLLTPTSPTTAFKLGENTNDPISMYLADAMTVPASLAGLAAMSIPVGVDSQGLPIGAQLIGPRMSDKQMLALAMSLENA